MTDPAETWEHTAVQHAGLRFDVRVAGPDAGEPVLLLHGFPQSSLSWTPVASLLAAAGLRVLAPDQRGYSAGARPDAVDAYGVPTLADDALGIAAALGHDSFHLVGHDWGAAVAWHLAAHHPDRVRSLTALSVPHLAAFGRALVEDEEQARRSSYIGLFREPGHAEEVLMADDAARLRAMYEGTVAPEDVEAYVQMMRDGALTPALNWYRAMGRDLDTTPPVRVPTTYVWGEGDLAVSPTAAHACGDFVEADFRLVPLAGGDHWTPDAAPDLVARAVLERVASVTA